MIDDKLVTYIKEGLAKGYSAEQLKNAMLAQNVAVELVDEAFDFVKLERHEVRKDHYLLLVIGGVLLMLLVYLFRIFSAPPPAGGSTFGRVISGFWPLAFPILANVANALFYRKSFIKGLVLTFIILIFMVLLVVGFAFLGYATAVQ